MLIKKYLFKIRKNLSITPYKSIKNSIGLIRHYFKNGKVKMSICNGQKCDNCKCNQ